MVDFNWLIGTLIGVIALGFTVTFLFVNYTYKKKTDEKTYFRQDTVEMKREQQEIAKKVKEEIHEYVRVNIESVNSKITAAIDLGSAKRELIENKITNIRTEIEDMKDSQKDDITRLEKAIYFLQQFQWGRDAKSIAPYTIGEEASQEHKNINDKGIFADD